MAGLMDDLMGQLGPGGIDKIASTLGVDASQAQNAIGMALPAILGGMANNAAKPEGAQALSNAVDKHDPAVIEGLGGLGSLTDLLGDGGGILGHVLGQKQAPVEKQIAGNSGLDIGQVAKLLPMLAPLVMSFLNKQKTSNGLDAGGLGSLLSSERKEQETKSPGLGGLASILDANDDGSIMDDVMGMATGSKKGGLSGMLGKLLGR